MSINAPKVPTVSDRKRWRIIAIRSLLGIAGLSLIVVLFRSPATSFLWKGAGDFFREGSQGKESVSEVDSPDLPFLTSVVQKELTLGQTTTFDGFRVSFRTDPETPQAGVPIQLLWSITESEGTPVSLDSSIHQLPMHAYVLRSDLGSDLKHLHPSTSKEELEPWNDSITFSSGGLWYVVMQFAKDGTVYNVAASVFVEGKAPESFLPDFARKQKINEWTVRLQDTPKKVFVGEPAAFTFVVEGKRELQKGDLNGGHNVIFAFQGEPFIWNMHGDRSVERISQDVGFTLQRSVPTTQDPFSYIVTFPKAGLWLIHFEINSQPARFFINVDGFTTGGSTGSPQASSL